MINVLHPLNQGIPAVFTLLSQKVINIIISWNVIQNMKKVILLIGMFLQLDGVVEITTNQHREKHQNSNIFRKNI